MKKTCLILTSILFSYTAKAQTDIQNNLLRFPTGGNPTPTYLQEDWGINIFGTGIQPVKVRNTSLMVGYASANQDFGIGNALISGRLGIGTTNLSNVLTLNSPDGANMILQANNANIAAFAVNSNSSTWNGGYGIGLNLVATAADINLQTGNTAASSLVIKNSGNVGIGTTDPTAKLDVNGLIAMQHYGYVSSQRNANNGFTNLFLGGAIKDNGNGTFTVVGDGGSNYFSAIRMDNGATNFGSINFYNGTATSGADYTLSNNDLAGYMKMTINGNAIGIGTNTPDQAYRLSVNGNIRSKEVKVETGWSDYVFKKDYLLKTLPEVAAYIAKQGHLPDVPSAEEVKKNGVNVGETESLLLKKIEELTLYLIEKDKEVKDLKLKLAKNEMLEERLSRLELLLKSPKAKN